MVWGESVEYDRRMYPRGAYTARRAAALSGVPLSTVHHWARQGVLVPTVSPRRVKLWSYSDLMGLRTISWLRHPKSTGDGAEVPATTMRAVRRALEVLRELDLDLWSEDSGPNVSVTRAGEVIVAAEPRIEGDSRQYVLPSDDVLDLIAPFRSAEGGSGPDLVRPRPRLRIVPGRLSGAPHVAHSRVESEALASLTGSGVPVETVYRLYPDLDPRGIDDALDLERQLAA